MADAGRAERMNEQTRFNLADMIRRLAGIGRDDPTIAGRLGITVAQVRGIRREFDIPAGERRWLPHEVREAGRG